MSWSLDLILLRMLTQASHSLEQKVKNEASRQSARLPHPRFTNGGSLEQRAAVQPKRRSTGETRKKADRFTLLKRITKLKSVNSAIRSRIQVSHLERYSPKGSCHLDEPAWITHTCSELSLRSLLWSASYVQKQSINTWQEWVGEGTWKGIKELSSP